MLALLGAVSSAMGLAVSALAPSGDIALAVGPAVMVTELKSNMFDMFVHCLNVHMYHT